MPAKVTLQKEAKNVTHLWIINGRGGCELAINKEQKKNS